MGEDLIIEPLVRDIKKGFYVDVGAHHPFRGSNTCLLYKRGWSGINIEPNRQSLWWFRLFRRRDVNLGIGITSNRGEKTYYRFSDPGFNTFNAEVARKLKSKQYVSFLGATEVPVQTLASLFLAHGVSRIDLLDVDIEGGELEVLQSNDWSRWKPYIIIVEDRTLDLSTLQENKIYQFLTQLGYSLYASTKINLIFVVHEA